MPMSVPKRIKFWRQVRELTQAELGKELDVSQATIADVERGRPRAFLDAANLTKIAEKLNVPVAYLQEDGPDPLTLLEPPPRKKERIRA